MKKKRLPDESEDSVTTTVEFDRTTYKKLKLLAVERDTTVRDLIREAVRTLLGTPSKKGGPS